MAAEVLVQLERADAIPAWTAAYAERLSGAGSGRQGPERGRLAAVPWARPSGSPNGWLSSRPRWPTGPWLPWSGEWVPRLVPGTVGAATHGLIRTAHGLRALGEADTLPRRLEVATGLAYWASSYQELPGPPLLIGHQDVPGGLGRPSLPARGGPRPVPDQ